MRTAVAIFFGWLGASGCSSTHSCDLVLLSYRVTLERTLSVDLASVKTDGALMCGGTFCAPPACCALGAHPLDAQLTLTSDAGKAHVSVSFSAFENENPFELRLQRTDGSAPVSVDVSVAWVGSSDQCHAAPASSALR